MEQLKNLILIYGDEDYLKEEKKNELLKALNAEGSMNFNAFSDENVDIDEIKRLSDTMPFLEDKRKILVSDSGFFRDSSGAHAEELLSEVPDSTVIIFVEKANVDRNSPMFRLVKKTGSIYRFDKADSAKGQQKTASRNEIRNWAKEKIQNGKRRIDTAALNRLLDRTGYDMLNLDTEIEKLLCYTLDRPDGAVITVRDIEDISSVTLADRVFEMLEFKMRGDVSSALAILEELYAMREPVQKILAVIMKQYTQAYCVKELRLKGVHDLEIAARLGIKDWMVSKTEARTSGSSLRDLRAALEKCADADYSIKTGNMPEKLALEVLIVT